jgi:serine/threonine protein kinase
VGLDPSAAGPSEAPTLAPGSAGSAPETEGPAVPGYEVLGVLGRGGRGVVYRARQVRANRTVALKMILAGGHAGEADLVRFQTEAQALGRLQRPNIVLRRSGETRTRFHHPAPAALTR